MQNITFIKHKLYSLFPHVFTHSINNCGNIRRDILRNVYGYVVIAVDQSHEFRIPHFIDTPAHPLV